jgi:hypothetical protein
MNALPNPITSRLAFEDRYNVSKACTKEQAIRLVAAELAEGRTWEIDYQEEALCDSMSANHILGMKDAEYGMSSADQKTAFAVEKAEALKDRGRVLTLIATGSDDAELGSLVRKAAHAEFRRECLRLAVREVEESRRFL